MPKSPRKENDAYQTDQILCQEILAALHAEGVFSSPPSPEGSFIVLEPSAGDGNFVEELSKLPGDWDIHAVDLVNDSDNLIRRGADKAKTGDFLTVDFEGVRYDAIVGNPPFVHAQEHILRALDLLRPGGTLAFLLRTAFQESHDRTAFWKEHPAYKVRPLIPRPSFTGNGKSDQQAYSVFLWKRGYKGPTIVEPLVWRAPIKKGKKAK
jgi:hypothetical protein